MFFNLRCGMLPPWFEHSIYETLNYIERADDGQLFDIRKSFEDIPFNFVDRDTLSKMMSGLREEFLRISEKPWPEERMGDLRNTGYYDCHLLLLDTFVRYPWSLMTKKGLSHSGKEALFLAEDNLPPVIFFFHTVYPLCWNVLDEKAKFPVKQHPIFPLFFRYMQEPLAVAMSLAFAEATFGKESRAMVLMRDFLSDLAHNYRAGLLLYECGLHLRWKDWRDDSKRCLKKTQLMWEWIAALHEFSPSTDTEQIILLWAQLFDLSAAVVQGLIAAARFAPIVSESKDLRELIVGLLRHVEKNPKEFISDKLKFSNNPLAEIIYSLAKKICSFEEAVSRIPGGLSENMIRDLIGNAMSSWSFSRDLFTDIFRIFGPVVQGIALPQHPDNPDKKEIKSA